MSDEISGEPKAGSRLDGSAHYVARINDYLITGGLFNPEYMLHDNVRDLLIEIRDFLKESNASGDSEPKQSKEIK